jgi:hypothetical protein
VPAREALAPGMILTSVTSLHRFLFGFRLRWLVAARTENTSRVSCSHGMDTHDSISQIFS